MKINKLLILMSILCSVCLISSCVFDPSKFYPVPESEKYIEPDFRFSYIEGLPNTLNKELRNLVKSTAKYNGRKIAIFSVDGALLNQTPYYAADEAVYSYAKKHPDWKPDLIDKMLKEDKNGKEYITDRALYWSGLSTEQVEDIGYEVLRKHYFFYPQIYSLVANLKTNNFEIWVITSSPEVLYQKLLAEYLSIPKNRIIGTKTVIDNNILSEKIIPPILLKNGKKEAVETFIKATPMIVVGHSYADVNMINCSKNIRIVINPDNKIKHKSLNNMCIDEYAVKNNWTILDIKDIPTERSAGMVSGKYNIKQNEKIDV